MTYADDAAARELGDPNVLHGALRVLAADRSGQEGIDSETRARIARSSVGQSRHRPLVDATVRLVTLALGALVLASICLSIHASSAWLGVIACLFFVAGFVTLTRPALKRRKSLGKPHEVPHT